MRAVKSKDCIITLSESSDNPWYVSHSYKFCGEIQFDSVGIVQTEAERAWTETKNNLYWEN